MFDDTMQRLHDAQREAKGPFPNVLRLRLESDSDLEDPREFDLAWDLIPFISDHVKSEPRENYLLETWEEVPVYGGRKEWRIVKLSPANIGIRRKLAVGTAFLLDYYEHGRGAWSINGEGMQCQWDTSSASGIMIFRHPAHEMGAKSYADRRTDARGFLETFNAWANGDGLYFSLETYAGDHVNSCGGFYGADDLPYLLGDHAFPSIRHYAEREIGKGCDVKFMPESEWDEDSADYDPFVLYVLTTGDAADLLMYQTLDVWESPAQVAAA